MAEFEAYPRQVLQRGKGQYPPQLSLVPNAPEKLYVIGNVAALSSSMLAVVGARRATPYGLDCAHMFSSRAAARGVGIVSGGAIGCDQSATSAALERINDGQSAVSCVIVLAGGADVIYPRGAKRLFLQVLESGGALVSENEWGSDCLRARFVERNRIIAGLALATLIVEAGLPSGTFSTADDTLSYGRDLLVVPGSIMSPESKGSNRLLVQGATPIVDYASFDAALDMTFGLGLNMQEPETRLLAGLSKDKADLVSMVAANAMRPPEIGAHLHLDSAKVMRLITACEACGLIERYRDGRYGLARVK